MRALLCVGMVVALAGSLVAADAREGQDPKKAGPEVKGKVVKVDPRQKTLTLAMAEGKKDFAVSNDTRVIDPKGGMCKDGLMDRRLIAGAEVKLVLEPDGKTVKEIHFLVAEAKRGGAESKRGEGS